MYYLQFVNIFHRIFLLIINFISIQLIIARKVNTFFKKNSVVYYEKNETLVSE